MRQWYDALGRARQRIQTTQGTGRVLRQSVRSLKNLHVISPDQLNAYDVLVSDDIVFTKAAYDAFVSFKTNKEEVGA